MTAKSLKAKDRKTKLKHMEMARAEKPLKLTPFITNQAQTNIDQTKRSTKPTENKFK